jgi:hypothetical protein
LDRDPSNNAQDNLAFLCLEHHTTYDSIASQHKNFTEAEVKHWREELYLRLAKIRPSLLPTPLPKSMATQADEGRKKDLESIKTIFRTIHWPTLDQHVKELPYTMIGPVLHFWEGFHGTVSSSLFHIYDPALASEIQELHKQWSITVSFGIHYIPSLNGNSIFANPGHQPFSSKEERDWKTIQKAAIALANAKKQLLNHVRHSFDEVDVTKLSNKAWRDYLALQKMFSR